MFLLLRRRSFVIIEYQLGDNNLKIANMNDAFIILSIALAQTAFLYILVYPEFFVNGDNEFYNKAYGLISKLGIIEAYITFQSQGGSGSEPLSFLFMFLSSKFLSYSQYFYISNVVFISIFGLVLRRLFCQWSIAYLILCFSFYVFIASGLTQRLAIAILFWLYAETVSCSSKKGKGLLQLLSILSHWQMMIVFISKICAAVLKNVLRLRVSHEHLLLMLLIPVGIYFIFDELLIKILHKLTGAHVDALLILVWPCLLRLLAVRIKIEQIMVYGGLFVTALFITSGRLNIICFFYSILVMRGNSKAILYFALTLTPYFIYKHFDYFSHYYLPGRVFGL